MTSSNVTTWASRRAAPKYQSNMLDQPFWKVMAFVMAGLVLGASTMIKSALNKLDKINDTQIEMKVLLGGLMVQQEKIAVLNKEMCDDIDLLKMKQAQLDIITRNKFLKGEAP